MKHAPATLTCKGAAEVHVFHAGYEYAVFTLFEREGGGYFSLSIESSFGTGYAYAWSHPGNSFKRFLAQLDVDYVRTKMVPNDDVFDGEATTRAVKEEIAEIRREKICTAEQARDAWPEREFEHECDFARWLDAIPGRMYDQLSAWELGCRCGGRRTIEFTALYECFWPAFGAAITERASVAASAEVSP